MFMLLRPVIPDGTDTVEKITGWLLVDVVIHELLICQLPVRPQPEAMYMGTWLPVQQLVREVFTPRWPRCVSVLRLCVNCLVGTRNLRQIQISILLELKSAFAVVAPQR